MADLTQNYIKWISDFTKVQFDELVECYIRNVWKIEDLVITDGTNDGGNDIRIFVDNRKLKIQIQVTVQETALDTKISKELNNAAENVKKYGYQNKLIFFYSQSISEDKANLFELQAKNQFDIELTLVDVKKMAFTSKFIPELIEVIHKQYGLELKEENKILNDEDRMLYDFVSFNSSSNEIKKELIKSYIIHKIYECRKIKREDLLNGCINHFKSKDSTFFSREIETLKREGKITDAKDTPIQLTETEEKRIDTLKEQFNFLEQKLLVDITDQLSKFKVSADLTLQVVEKLRELFEANFNIDKQEILDKAYTLNEDENIESFTKFFKYLKRISGSSEKAKLLSKRLITVCKENDILQQLSAGKLFTSFQDPDVIKNYSNQKDRLIFIDTQIVLYLLCVSYKTCDYPNPYYQSVKECLELKDRHQDLNYNFYFPYLYEVGYHLKEALLLIPYDKLGFVHELGGSNNVFLTFYEYLQKNNLLEPEIETFADFVDDAFELSETDAFNVNFFKITDGLLRERLEQIDILIDDGDYDRENFEIAKKVIIDCLVIKDRYRPEQTINNDAKMLTILFDKETSTNEPIFISWDSNFFASRKEYHKRYSHARLWHWFTPNQFVNHISLLKLEINSSSITREILSILDESFSLYKRAQNLLDTASKLINITNETGLKYVKKIKEFRKEYIYQIEKALPEEETIVEETIYPVEVLIINLAKHYTFNDKKYTLDEFKEFLTEGQYFDSMIKLFEKQLHYMQKNKTHAPVDFYTEINVLIDDSKSKKTFKPGAK